jgi:outer membrane receptor protein involved in Fe transport
MEKVEVRKSKRKFPLKYDPDPVGDLVYNGIAASILHAAFSNGVQGDSTYRWNDRNTVEAGFYVSGETLEEDNHASVFPTDSMGNPQTVPSGIVDNFNGKVLLFGLYAQDQWHPINRFEVTLGVRWDLMDYLVSQNQFSPRAGAVYNLTSTTTLNAGYARYFQVPPFESVLLETATKFANTTGASPVLCGNQNFKAESDNFFDVGVNQALTMAGERQYRRLLLSCQKQVGSGPIRQHLYFCTA